MRRIVQRYTTTIQITSIEIRWDDDPAPDESPIGASVLDLPAGAATPKPVGPRKRKPKVRVRRAALRDNHPAHR